MWLPLGYWQAKCVSIRSQAGLGLDWHETLNADMPGSFYFEATCRNA
jgi:hypothetical protein